MAKIQLKSGGYVEITSEIDLFALSWQDRQWLVDLVDFVNGYGLEDEEPVEAPEPLTSMNIHFPADGAATPVWSFSSGVQSQPRPEPAFALGEVAPASEPDPDEDSASVLKEWEPPAPEAQEADEPSTPKAERRPKRVTVSAEKRRVAVLEVLRKTGGSTVSEIREQLTDVMARTDVSNALYVLKQNGKLTNVDGVWSVKAEPDTAGIATKTVEIMPEIIPGKTYSAADFPQVASDNGTKTIPPNVTPSELPAWRMGLNGPPAPAWHAKELEETAAYSLAQKRQREFGPIAEALPKVQIEGLLCERCKQTSERVCPTFIGGRVGHTENLCRDHTLRFCESNRLTLEKAESFAHPVVHRIQPEQVQ